MGIFPFDIKTGTLMANQERKSELDSIIETENLDPVAAQKFVDRAFSDGQLQLAGPALTNMLPPKNMFSPENVHGLQKESVLSKLQTYSDRFFGL